MKKTYAQWEVVNNYGPETWRRMIYQERMRRVDDRIFTAFDFPDCGQVRDKRPVSTTPLQALNFYFFYTSYFFCFVTFFWRLLTFCFELLFGRPPDASELSLAINVANDRGLEIVCRSLINSNEFAFLP